MGENLRRVFFAFVQLKAPFAFNGRDQAKMLRTAFNRRQNPWLVLAKESLNLKVLGLVMNSKVRRAFDCSGDQKLGLDIFTASCCTSSLSANARPKHLILLDIRSSSPFRLFDGPERILVSMNAREFVTLQQCTRSYWAKLGTWVESEWDTGTEGCLVVRSGWLSSRPPSRSRVKSCWDNLSN